MLAFSLFFIELFMLFLLSRNLTRTISQVVFRLTRSQKSTIMTIAFLFLPGTVLHELSHAVIAQLVGVPVGTMEFFPRIEGDHVKLGSVQVGRTDPFRRFLIGAAPFFIGTTIMLSVLFYMVQQQFFTNYLFIILTGYVTFEIGNTMFSSRKDMEGALELFVGIIAIIIILYFFGVRFSFLNPTELLSQPVIQELFTKGSFFLLIPLAIDLIFILFFRILQKK
jgi:hypothetical protein